MARPPIAAVALLVCATCVGVGAMGPAGRWEQEVAQAGTAPRAPPPCGGAGVCGSPLNVSPLIADGKIKEARDALAVTGLGPLFDGSFSGMVTTNAGKGDALWFWFLPAQVERKNASAGSASAQPAPTVVWLQGGPGAPSTYGMFTEIGPAIVGNGSTLSARAETWNRNLAILVVDNPSGVGFSPLGNTDKPVVNARTRLWPVWPFDYSLVDFSFVAPTRPSTPPRKCSAPTCAPTSHRQ